MMDERSADFLVNDAIKDYIFDLHQATRFSRVQSEVDALYGLKFHELSKAYYGDKTAWPSPSTISSLTPDPATGKGSDELFLCFYKEMADRHWFATGRPTAQDSVNTWNNYVKLFGLLAAGTDVMMTCNEQWAFDVVHEFVYSFQGFCQFRADPSRCSADDLEVLRANPTAWSVAGVSSCLRSLVKSSNVEAVLAEAKAKGTPSGLIDFRERIATPCRLSFDLGYFALFGLSRLECLLGDYHASLAVLAPIDLFSDHEYYHKVFACYLQLAYHAGVAYLMARRFGDAKRTLAHVVLKVHRLAKSGALTFAANQGLDEQAAKKTAERSAALLACCCALLPGSNNSNSSGAGGGGESAAELAAGMGKDAGRLFLDRVAALETSTDASDFEQVFENACPKFVSAAVHPVPSAADASAGVFTNMSHEPLRRQVELFGKQAASLHGATKCRSFLKLYTATQVAKLAKFTDQTPDEFRSALLAAKHKLYQPESAPGLPPLGGERAWALDVHFFVSAEGAITVDDGTDMDGARASPRHEQHFMEELARATHVEEQVRAGGMRFAAEMARLTEASAYGGYDDDRD